MKKQILSVAACIFVQAAVFAQTDTLRVMTYNVLNYGELPSCQGPYINYHNYLKTIVAYARPDVLGLVKMGAMPVTVNDPFANASAGFADSIVTYALDAANGGSYAYCPYTNAAHTDNMGVLFYNQDKLGFLSIASSYANITDFNTYKLYYKDPNLAATHDTTFLYVTLNHDQSGDNSGAVRGAQIVGEMQHIATHFNHLPNMLNMGDFNTRNSQEACYQTLTAPTDTNFLFYDPPFNPDAHAAYPADWTTNPSPYAAFLTTSTRSSDSQPNSCGTGGGAKSWYDHIFISPWILNNANYIQYIPNSYHVLGNDGQRLGVAVNAGSPVVNASAPADVLEALYQMSNKYPVLVNLLVTMNTTGTSPADPDVSTAVTTPVFTKEEVTISNPVNDAFIMHFTPGLIGQKIKIECVDMAGKQVLKESLTADSATATLPVRLKVGNYVVKFYTKHNLISQATIVKE